MKTLQKMNLLTKNNVRYFISLMAATSIALGSGVNANAEEEAIVYSFSNESMRHWQFVSDGVMGGVSKGELTFGKENGTNFGRLTGTVSTENNGGFIQFRASLSFNGRSDNGKNIKGLRLNARGNETEYFIHFRTADNWYPSDYYFAKFKVKTDWASIDLPFSNFKRSRSDQSILLNGSNIRSMGIVAYGRDHTADVSVSRIEFYY